MKTFTNVDDKVLIETISRATNRIVFVAPGLSKDAALALKARIGQIPHKNVAIVLDVDPEVCRLGYGDIEGLECVRQVATEWGITLDHQPGIRIGVLIADGHTLIYTPTPQLIEAGSSTPAHPNAISLDAKEVPSLEAACGATADCLKREVGLDPVKDSTVQAVKQDLAVNPPKKFNVARAERVFNSAMQYVEFHFTDFRLAQKEASIPPELMGLADDPDLRVRWRNGFRLFTDKKSFEVKLTLKDAKGREKEETYTEQKVEREKQQILKEFVITIPNYGAFILRNQRQRFVDRIQWFEDLVNKFKEAVSAQIEAELKKSKVRLIEYLVPKVCENPPSSWKSTMLDGDKLTPEEAAARLDACLSSDFSAVDKIFAPEIKVTYKNLAYETIKDEGFLSAAHKAFTKVGAESIFKTLFKEYDAAPEIGNKPTQAGAKR